MFNVFVNNGINEMPDDDILYIVCKEGIYLKKKLGIMESITPVKNISTLETVQMMATMHIKPIPAFQFAQVESFFREVYKEHHSEAIVLLFYNEERKVYKIVPPHQKVNGGSVDYNRAITIDGFNMIGDIHSHANMSAFHSGVDDKDEESFDGLHITIGNCGSENVSISASIVSNAQRFIVEPSDYINRLALTRDIDEEIEKPYSQVFIWDKNQKKMVPKPGNQKTYTVRRFDKRYIVDVSNKYRKFDPKWMDLVEHRPYTYTYGIGGSYWQDWRRQANGWPNSFDANAWKNFNRQNTPGKAKPSQQLIPYKTKTPITFPPHDQSADGAHEEIVKKKDFNPCLDCAFKDYRIDWVLENLTNKEGDDLLDIYECTKCESVFSTSEAMAVCPNCKVDDHLILMNDDTDDDDDDQEVYSCTNCDSTFSTEEFNPVCPICKVNDHLILLEEALTDTEDVDWFRCDKCNIVFDTVEKYPKCPQCKGDGGLVQLQYSTSSDDEPDMDEKVYKYKCPHCGSETNELNDGYECPFCSQTIDDPIEQAGNAAEAMNNLAQAIEADKELERLPIPDQDHTPINRTQKKSRRGIFRNLFNKGGKQ
jgi:PRTRC genetic system protein A